ncbi:MAG: tRNA (5-methylaminomethyl-2-thiouridine)(34)-methyltransferase MnmD [Rikenellaceae bacterium]|nr:tRNA (5-methylaminomethyl-2-thiouridine)(34)-methyltransferase MnmD [Rikenellaceae bacterium]
MDFISPEIRSTADGSATLVSPSTGETYHSLAGAVRESEHIFIGAGLRRCIKNELSVLEAGFGSGLNAWLTAREAAATGRRVRYTAVELYPVDPAVLNGAGFPDDCLFRQIHAVEWGGEAVISETFTLRKIFADLAETRFDAKFDVVYFDMFAPGEHPHLWSVDVFGAIAAAMNVGAALVTYSAKGDVKRALRAAGLEVTRLPGAPGKRHMLRAVKP